MTSLAKRIRELRKNILEIVISSPKLSEYVSSVNSFPVNNLKVIEFPRREIREYETEKLFVKTINLLSFNIDTEDVEYINVDTGQYEKENVLNLYNVSVLTPSQVNDINTLKSQINILLDKYNLLMSLIYRKDKYLNLTESELDNLILKLQ